jgi:DNA-binding LacI/PurR family transcriptional regulator
MSKSPTIHDLAADLNISATTVWRALNNRDRVSAKTRERVQARALAINYEPSLVAQNLSHGRTSTLGMLVPRIGNPIFATMVEVVEQVAYEHGYCVILCNILNDRETAYTRMLYRRRVEGVVVVPFGQHTKEAKDWDTPLAELEEKGVPVVLLEQGLASKHFPTVVVDNYGAAYDMTRHLIGLGNKSLALVSHSSSDQDSIYQERVAGFTQAVSDAGLTEKAHLLLDAYEFTEGDWHYRPELIAQCFARPDRPTAVFALSDTLAIRIMETLRKMGFDIPRDVAVAGFDNIMLAEHTFPSLTTVQQPTDKMARRATEILFDQIEAKAGVTREPVYERLPCELIIRESCGAPRSLRTL